MDSHQQDIGNQVTKVEDLHCEFLKNPFGIHTSRPSLGWKLKSSERGKRQTAYRIIAASSKERLDKGDFDLWDSSIVHTERSFHVVYEGKNLSSGQGCYWKVQVWDENESMIEPTETAYWEMGLLTPKDWRGDWIGMGSQHIPGWSPLFRKEISLHKEIKNARAYICGLGYYELYINGRKVGDHVLDPAQTDYEERVMYMTYDVISLLQTGGNAISIILGDGWYHQNRVWKNVGHYGQPRVVLQVNIEYEDGSRIHVCTDESWKTSYGPITLNNIYAGETYDARLEQPGWNQPNFDDGRWFTAEKVEDPGGILIAQMLPPIKKMQVIEPVKMTELKEGVYIYDLGRNFAGWVKLTVQGPAGSEIVLRFAEDLDENGHLETDTGGTQHTQVIQTDRYILKGSGTEEWEPRFTYHGFRFVEVSGVPGVPTLDCIQGHAVYTSLEESGAFQCSDEMINQIHTLVKDTVTSNIHSIITDCPVRERCGWLGDAMIMTDSLMYNWNSASFWRKFTKDIGTTRKLRGQWHQIAPGKRLGGEAAAAWGSAQVAIPWFLYHFYEDRNILEEHYELMKAWVYHLRDRAEDYIVTYGKTDDWWPPGSRQNRDCPTPLISTAYFFLSATIMEKVANVLSYHNDQEQFRKLAAKIKAAFNQIYFNEDKYTYGSQTADCFALYLGIVPNGKERAVVNSLAEDIIARDIHVTTGHIGVKYIFEVLSEYGYGDLTQQLLDQTSYPSFGHQIASGATTLWESWEGYKDFPEGRVMGSLSHPFKGGYDSWFYSHLLGIQTETPGFKEIIIKPYTIGDLSFAKGYYDSIGGRIVSEWKIENGLFTLHVEVPGNTTAKIYLPAKDNGRVLENGIPASQGKGIEYIGTEGHDVIYRIGSGSYHFSCPQ